MLRKRRGDRVDGFLGRAGKQIQPAQRGTRVEVIGVGINRAQKELRRFTRIAELFGDHTVLVARFAIGRHDLQRVAKLDAGFLQIPGGEKRLSLLEMARLTGLGPATAGNDQRRADCGGQNRAAFHDTRHNSLPR